MKAIVYEKYGSPEPEDLKFINDLIEAGKLKSVIDRCYPLEQIADAHRHSETGHAKGKIIVTVAGES